MIIGNGVYGHELSKVVFEGNLEKKGCLEKKISGYEKTNIVSFPSHHVEWRMVLNRF
jgi:hypothetical protein